MPTATFPEFFHWAFAAIERVMCVQNLKSAALPVLEIIWGTQKS